MELIWSVPFDFVLCWVCETCCKTQNRKQWVIDQCRHERRWPKLLEEEEEEEDASGRFLLLLLLLLLLMFNILLYMNIILPHNLPDVIPVQLWR